MSSTTPNLLLVKETDSENYNVATVNGNSDKIDAGWKNHEDRLDAIEAVDHTNSGGFVTITTVAGGLSPNIAHGLGRTPKHIDLTQATNSGSAPIYLTIDDTSWDDINFKFRAFRVDTGAAFVGPVKLTWEAV